MHLKHDPRVYGTNQNNIVIILQIKRNKLIKNAEYLVMWLWCLILHVNLMREAKRRMTSWLNIIFGCVRGGLRKRPACELLDSVKQKALQCRWASSKPVRPEQSKKGREVKHPLCLHQPSGPCVYEVWHRLPLQSWFSGLHTGLHATLWTLCIPVFERHH